MILMKNYEEELWQVWGQKISRKALCSSSFQWNEGHKKENCTNVTNTRDAFGHEHSSRESTVDAKRRRLWGRNHEHRVNQK